MLLLLLLIFCILTIGFQFSRLAFDYDKKKGKYITFSILIFLGVSYGFQIASGVIIGLIGSISILTDPIILMLIALFCYILGGIAVWIYYRYLDKTWKQEANL